MKLQTFFDTAANSVQVGLEDIFAPITITSASNRAYNALAAFPTQLTSQVGEGAQQILPITGNEITVKGLEYFPRTDDTAVFHDITYNIVGVTRLPQSDHYVLQVSREEFAV